MRAFVPLSSHSSSQTACVYSCATPGTLWGQGKALRPCYACMRRLPEVSAARRGLQPNIRCLARGALYLLSSYNCSSLLINQLGLRVLKDMILALLRLKLQMLRRLLILAV